MYIHVFSFICIFRYPIIIKEKIAKIKKYLKEKKKKTPQAEVPVYLPLEVSHTYCGKRL